MSAELRIRNLLNSGKSLDYISENILNLSASIDATSIEIESITQFLIRAGMYREAFLQYPRRFYEGKLIPWPHFIEILNACDIKPNKSVLNAMFEGAQKSKSHRKMVLNRNWDHIEVQFKELRRELWRDENEALERKKESMKQKIEFLRNNRMLKEEQKAYQKYLEMFPKDEQILTEFNHFQERWAREVIEKKIEQIKVDEHVEDNLPTLSAEEIEVCDIIFKDVEKRIKESPSMAYDFALMFLNFEFISAALKILEPAEGSIAKKWLKLELLYESNYLLSVLEECNNIESENPDDTETRFAVAYMQAKAYKKLGQKAKAIDLLKNIIQLRPTYRSAPSLLLEIIEDRD